MKALDRAWGWRRRWGWRIKRDTESEREIASPKLLPLTLTQNERAGELNPGCLPPFYPLSFVLVSDTATSRPVPSLRSFLLLGMRLYISTPFYFLCVGVCARSTHTVAKGLHIFLSLQSLYPPRSFSLFIIVTIIIILLEIALFFSPLIKISESGNTDNF